MRPRPNFVLFARNLEIFAIVLPYYLVDLFFGDVIFLRIQINWCPIAFKPPNIFPSAYIKMWLNFIILEHSIDQNYSWMYSPKRCTPNGVVEYIYYVPTIPYRCFIWWLVYASIPLIFGCVVFFMRSMSVCQKVCFSLSSRKYWIPIWSWTTFLCVCNIFLSMVIARCMIMVWKVHLTKEVCSKSFETSSFFGRMLWILENI